MPFSSYAKGQTELLTLANRIGEEIADNYRQQQATEALAEYRKEQLANRQDNTAIRRDDLNRKIDADAARNQYNYLRTLGVPVAGNSRPRTTSLPGGTVPVYAPAPQRQSPKRTDNYVPYCTPENNALYARVKRRVPLTAEDNTRLSGKLGKFVEVPTYTQHVTVLNENSKELLKNNGIDPSGLSDEQQVAAFTDLTNRIALSTLMEKAEQERSGRQETIDLENAGADMEAEAEYNKLALPTGPNPLAAVAKLSNQYNAAVQNAEEELKAKEKELNRVQNLFGLEARKKLENEIYAKHRVPELKKAWDDLRIPVESAMSGYELLPAEKGGNDVIGTTPDGKPLTYNQHMQNLQKEKLAEIQGMISSYNQTVADRVYRKPRPDAELVLPTDEEITARYRKILDESPEYFRIEERQVERDKNSPQYRRYEAMSQAYKSGDYNKLISLMTPEERKAAGIDVRAVNNYIKEENLRKHIDGALGNGEEPAKKTVTALVKRGVPLEVAASYAKQLELQQQYTNKKNRKEFINDNKDAAYVALKKFNQNENYKISEHDAAVLAGMVYDAQLKGDTTNMDIMAQDFLNQQQNPDLTLPTGISPKEHKNAEKTFGKHYSSLEDKHKRILTSAYNTWLKTSGVLNNEGVKDSNGKIDLKKAAALLEKLKAQDAMWKKGITQHDELKNIPSPVYGIILQLEKIIQDNKTEEANKALIENVKESSAAIITPGSNYFPKHDDLGKPSPGMAYALPHLYPQYRDLGYFKTRHLGDRAKQSQKESDNKRAEINDFVSRKNYGN